MRWTRNHVHSVNAGGGVLGGKNVNCRTGFQASIARLSESLPSRQTRHSCNALPQLKCRRISNTKAHYCQCPHPLPDGTRAASERNRTNNLTPHRRDVHVIRRRSAVGFARAPSSPPPPEAERSYGDMKPQGEYQIQSSCRNWRTADHVGVASTDPRTYNLVVALTLAPIEL